MARGHRFVVDFSESAHQELFSLAERQQRTPAEVLGNAIALHRWCEEMQAAGNRILVESPSGRVQELTLR
jgi:hypothetical protein